MERSGRGETGDLSLSRTNEPKHLVDSTERRGAGLGGVYLPGPVSWLQMDGERAYDVSSGSAMAWRENPGEEAYLLTREKAADPLPWMEEHGLDGEGPLKHLAGIHWPGRGGRPVGLVPSRIWKEFLRRIDLEPLVSGEVSAAALVASVRSDAEEMRTRQILNCGQSVMVGIYREKRGGEASPPRVDFRRWRCKAWPCPHCSRRLQYEAGQKLAPQLAALEGSARPIFATYTLDRRRLRKRYPYLPERSMETLSWKLIRHYFKQLIKRLRRRYGQVEYSLRIEGHKSGWSHLHVVASSPGWYEAIEAEREKEKAWMEDSAVRAGYGPICDVQIVAEPRSMAWYLAKASSLGPAGLTAAMSGEMTKASQLRSHLIPRGTRTLERSRGWGKLPCTIGGRAAILADVGPKEDTDRVERVYSSIGMMKTDLGHVEWLRTGRTQEGLGPIGMETSSVRDWAVGADLHPGELAPKVLERIREVFPARCLAPWVIPAPFA